MKWNEIFPPIFIYLSINNNNNNKERKNVINQPASERQNRLLACLLSTHSFLFYIQMKISIYFARNIKLDSLLFFRFSLNYPCPLGGHLDFVTHSVFIWFVGHRYLQQKKMKWKKLKIKSNSYIHQNIQIIFVDNVSIMNSGTYDGIWI